MKKIARKSHEKEIAYELSKKVTQTKLGGGGYFSPPPVQIGLKPSTSSKSAYRQNLNGYIVMNYFLILSDTFL